MPCPNMDLEEHTNSAGEKHVLNPDDAIKQIAEERKALLSLEKHYVQKIASARRFIPRLWYRHKLRQLQDSLDYKIYASPQHTM